MLEAPQPTIHILDAGAGVGSLFASCVAELSKRKNKPDRIIVTAYELDPMLCEYLQQTMQVCEIVCEDSGIKFIGNIRQVDFLESAADILSGGLFATTLDDAFNCAVLNPPYYKINSQSRARRLLREIGIETSNIYTGFLAAATRLLSPDGELVAITPRSFCNGPYFRPFREFFLSQIHLQRLHLFASRSHAFREDDVLQENLIIHVKKSQRKPRSVRITCNEGPTDTAMSSRTVPYDDVIRPNDPETFIHMPIDDVAAQVVAAMDQFHDSLQDLGITVSTGRVVDFRARLYLRDRPRKRTVPLIYPNNLTDGYVVWPKEKSKKPSAIVVSDQTASLLVPSDYYVLVKRFSAKEEKRRVVAAVYDPRRIPYDSVGFENHLNYFHKNGQGLDASLAKGLAAYLNSTLLDAYFRQFSGHTQVNATDLRRLSFPSADALRQLGESIPHEFPNQDTVDALIDRELLQRDRDGNVNPIRTMKRIDEALQAVKDLGLPKAQQNERSALALLVPQIGIRLALNG